MKKRDSKSRSPSRSEGRRTVKKAAIDRSADRRLEHLLKIQKTQDQEIMLSETRALALGLAHKLRNRLGIVQTAAYNIKLKAADPRIDSSIGKIEGNVLACSQIINGLMAFARIETPRYEKVDIYDVLEECLDKAETILGGRNLAIKRNYRDIRGRRLDADWLQLREVFDNLVRNACQSLSGGQGTIEIGASIDDSNGEMAVCIRDSGVGIEPANLARIREPFFSTKADGVGLGLTACCRIVDLHGGRIDIQSEPLKGTAVTVFFPYTRES